MRTAFREGLGSAHLAENYLNIFPSVSGSRRLGCFLKKKMNAGNLGKLTGQMGTGYHAQIMDEMKPTK